MSSHGGLLCVVELKKLFRRKHYEKSNEKVTVEVNAPAEKCGK